MVRLPTRDSGPRNTIVALFEGRSFRTCGVELATASFHYETAMKELTSWIHATQDWLLVVAPVLLSQFLALFFLTLFLLARFQQCFESFFLRFLAGFISSFSFFFSGLFAPSLWSFFLSWPGNRETSSHEFYSSNFMPQVTHFGLRNKLAILRAARFQTWRFFVELFGIHLSRAAIPPISVGILINNWISARTSVLLCTIIFPGSSFAFIYVDEVVARNTTIKHINAIRK